jgi:uncharacterized protein (TIRG00374 family)
VLVIIGLLLGSVFLWFALRNVRWSEFAAALRAADVRYAPPFLLALFLFYWLKAIRWRQLLSPIRPTRARALFGAVMIGYAANAVLPMQLGELVRAHVAARRLDVPTPAALASIALERVFDLGLIVLLLPITLGTMVRPVDDVAIAGRIVALGALLLVGAVLLLQARTDFTVRMTAGVFFWLPASARARLTQHVRSAAAGLQAVRRPSILVAVTLSSIAQWACMLACVWLSVAAIGIEVPWQTALTLMVLTVIGVSLPTAPGYVGSIQLAFVLALKPAGVSPESALAASMFYHALAYVSVVVGGLFFLRRYGMRFGQLREADS